MVAQDWIYCRFSYTTQKPRSIHHPQTQRRRSLASLVWLAFVWLVLFKDPFKDPIDISKVVGVVKTGFDGVAAHFTGEFVVG